MGLHCTYKYQTRHKSQYTCASLHQDDPRVLYENHATTATTGSQRRGRKALSRDSGGARQLGISNQYDLADFSRMFAEARVKPAVLQNRFYATSGYDVDLRRFCTENGVVYQSFWTLTANRDVLFDEARGGGVKSGSADEARRLAMRGAVAAAAAANGKTPAQV